MFQGLIVFFFWIKEYWSVHQILDGFIRNAECRCFLFLMGVVACTNVFFCRPALAGGNLNSQNTAVAEALDEVAEDEGKMLTQLVCQKGRKYFLLNAVADSLEKLAIDDSHYLVYPMGWSRPYKGVIKVLKSYDLVRTRIELRAAGPNIALDCTIGYSGAAAGKSFVSGIDSGYFSKGDSLSFMTSDQSFVGDVGCSYYEWCGEPILFLTRISKLDYLWGRAIAYNVDSSDLSVIRTTGDVNWVVMKDDSVVGFTDDSILIVFDQSGEIIWRNAKARSIKEKDSVFF